jgi:hypothetical protein
MGNIIGEGFNPIIIDQINRREIIYGSINRNNEVLNYLNNKTGWCRLVSSVDIGTSPEIINRNLPNNGENLAKNFILFNGTSIQGGLQRGGVWPGTGDNNDFAYGIGGTNFGLRPMPGIIQATIKTETRGSLKTATINIKANSKEQFNIIDILYLRLGYTMLLEWGSSSYFNNDGSYEPNNTYSLVNRFLQGTDFNYSNYPEEINKERLNSNGNYDALIGKVVNFNWTFTKDGTYDITVILRSMGDIIESLKTNILLPNNNTGASIGALRSNVSSLPGFDISPSGLPIPKPPTPSPTSAVRPLAISNEIEKEFFRLEEELSKSPLLNDSSIYSDPNNSSNIDAYKQIYSGDIGGEVYYIRLGYFLKFIQNTIIPTVNNNTLNPLTKIDTEIDSNIIYLLNRQISTNPTICIFKKDIQNNTGRNYKFYKGLNTFVVEKNNNTYGKIMNAYFSMSWILTTMDSLKDENGSIPLYVLLKSLCDGWNKATGNFNKLEPIVDNDENIIKIIDQLTLPDKKSWLEDQNKSTTTAKFNVYINRPEDSSFIKNISFNTTVPPNLASMITIGATSKGYILGQDSTALSRMNAGLTDRFKKEITNGTADLGKEDQGKNALPTNFKEVYDAFDEYLELLNNYIINQASIEAFNAIASTFYEYDQAYQVIQPIQPIPGSAFDPNSPINQLTQFSRRRGFPSINSTTSILEAKTIIKQNPKQKSSSTIGFLPFDLQLVMDGLSGMKIYQMYEITSEFLPSNYPESLEFLIKGITNTIQNNEWTTTIESIATPKNVGGSKFGNTAVADASQNNRNTDTNYSQGSVISTLQETNSFLNDVLVGIGVPTPNQPQLRFMQIWRQHEGGKAAWNPFNTTLNTSNSIPYNYVSVRNYFSKEEGLRATINTLRDSRYSNVVNAIKNIKTEKDINNAISAVNSSPWGSKIIPSTSSSYITFNNLIYKSPIIKRS